MEIDSLAAALEHEHHEIDQGIEAFTAVPSFWEPDRQPLTRAVRALRRHIYLEEEILFPLLRQAEPGLAAPVAVMLREHARIWAALDSLEAAAGDDARLAICERLADQLVRHNRKEEKILYPRADDSLPEAAAARLRAFLGSGQVPEGWICAKAQPRARDPWPGCG